MKTGEGLITCGIPPEKWARVKIMNGVPTTHGTTINKGESVSIINSTAKRILFFIEERNKNPRPVFVQTRNGTAFLANIRSKDIRLID